ncbi:hypothetical protein EOM09_05305 [bacterium]|nr:hypothetical protein [bacterium]
MNEDKNSLNLFMGLVIGIILLGILIAFISSLVEPENTKLNENQNNLENNLSNLNEVKDREEKNNLDNLEQNLSEEDILKLNEVKNKKGYMNFLNLEQNVSLASNEVAKIYIKIQNTNDKDIFQKDLNENSSPLSLKILTIDEDNDIISIPEDFVVYNPQIDLEKGETNSYLIEIHKNSKTKNLTYFLKFTIKLDEIEYSEFLTLNII